jgi:hypothetical protein
MNITEILTQAQQSSDAVTDLLIELAQQNKEVSATAQYEKALDEINLVAKKQAEVWKELEDKSESSTWSASTGHISYKRGKVRDFEKVREHYNAQPETSSPKKEESAPVVNIERARYQVGVHPDKGHFNSTPGVSGPR